MLFSLYQLFSIAVLYLLLMFGMAYITEKGLIPEKVVQHPIVFTLSIGVYASAWAIYGVVGFAYQSGYNFIAYFFGISGAFFLAPIIINPILRLVHNHQLGSLADLFAYRYRSQSAGTLVSVVMLFALLPLLALQIQAVSESVRTLTGEHNTNVFALAFVFLIMLFTTLFGARHASTRERHPGLVVAIAFESLIKISAMVFIALFTLFHLFDGFTGLQAWLAEHPHSLNILYDPIKEGPWRTLLLPFFASAITMPHMYHMIFSERPSKASVRTASWAFPLLMLIMAITVPIIMWGALKAHVPIDPEYFILGIGIATQSPWVLIIAFIAGIAAASGVMIVVTLSLAIMTLNHILLPLSQPSSKSDIYLWLLWARRALIVLVLSIAYGFYQLLDGSQDLSELGLVAFVGTLQFAPGLIGVMFWANATRQGFLVGLTLGFIVWLLLLLLPMLANSQSSTLLNLFGLSYTMTIENWQVPTLIATLLNITGFTLTSLATKQSIAERTAAQICTLNNRNRPYRIDLATMSAEAFTQALAKILGNETAKREVTTALMDLNMNNNESRPYALRRLRDQIETNLSGLVGPSVAREIVDQSLPCKTSATNRSTEDIHFTEHRLEDYRHKLTGLAAELDSMRRFHRQVLNDLPIGVCTLTHDNEILSWNHAMEEITGIPSSSILGSGLWHLHPPWSDLLSDISRSAEHGTFIQRTLNIGDRTHWFNIHKAMIHMETVSDVDQPQHQISNLVLVIEDVTELRLLENNVAHNERLAAIGRLAAGVAHEVGNPITGIACLAQDIQSDLKEAPEAPRNAALNQMAAQILTQTKRVSTIVQSLVNFSHAGSEDNPGFQSINIRSTVQQSIDLLLLNPKYDDVHCINNCPDGLMIHANEQKIVQVFINLLSNAYDASPAGAKITISGEANPPPSAGIVVTVTDEGSGIPEHILQHVFDPFVTTKEPGKGTGLGLALVYRFIEDHNGQIEITSPVAPFDPTSTHADTAVGTKVAIWLPKHHPI